MDDAEFRRAFDERRLTGFGHRDHVRLAFIFLHEDPGLRDVNWLDTEGHGEGTMCLRWLLADETPVPVPRLVSLEALRAGAV